MKNLARKIFFKLPISIDLKNKMYYSYKSKSEKMQESRSKNEIELKDNIEYTDYLKFVLSIPKLKSKNYVDYCENKTIDSDIHLIAYYLTQFHPNKKNDEWWGKGTTEWTNVSKAVPQFAYHYQPRLPGELGYYDLRIKENMVRQIELAKNYGIKSFCFYYYWFDGDRLLEDPLNMFLNNKELNMNFCVSWVNENWTKRFSGTNTDVLMKIGETEESNIAFINSVLPLFSDERYLKIDGKPVLTVYRPANIPNTDKVIEKWRCIVKDKIGMDIYIIATQEKADSTDWIKLGFDAETEFQPKSVLPNIRDVSKKYKTIRKNFNGCIYDYEDIVLNKRYINSSNMNKSFYSACMPMWDNTARRDQNAVLFDGSTPELYGQWLDDLIEKTRLNNKIENKMIFLNAWNEWGEGAYLEPDRFWGYAYLQETFNALMRSIKNE